MNSMKMGLLFKHHCTIKVKKTCPHSHLHSRGRKALNRLRTHIKKKQWPPLWKTQWY